MAKKCTWKPHVDAWAAKQYKGCGRACYPGHDFCLFHLPLEIKRANPSIAEEFFKQFWLSFTGDTLNDAAGNFQGFVFPDGIDFQELDFRRSHERTFPNLKNSQKYEAVDFSWAKFGSKVSFASAQFGDFAHFFSAEFGDEVDFYEARFGDNATFMDAEFSDFADFEKTKYGDNAAFTRARFLADVDFDKARFGGVASFSTARFKGSASYSEANFEGRVYFDDAKFEDTVNFASILFSDAVSFVRADFGELVEFSRATFGGHAVFAQACFHGRANFYKIKGIESSFRWQAGQRSYNERRERILFAGKAFLKVPPRLSFIGTKFYGFVLFQRLDLSQARFQQVDLRNLSFFDSQINQTKFISCRWGSGPENRRYARRKLPYPWSLVRPRLLLDELICRDRHLEKQEMIAARNLDQSMDPLTWLWNRLRLAYWRGNYDPDIRSFSQVEEMEILPSDIEVLGLQLKQSLEATKDPITAGDFHFAVMEMKREQARKANRWGRAFMLWLYKTINGYGERYVRAGFWLALMIAILAFVYFQLNGLDATVCVPKEKLLCYTPNLEFGQRVWFSIAYAFQHVLPFKFYGNYLCPVGPNLHWVRGLAMLETFLGTAFFAFFALALRRRFKR